MQVVACQFQSYNGDQQAPFGLDAAAVDQALPSTRGPKDREKHGHRRLQYVSHRADFQLLERSTAGKVTHRRHRLFFQKAFRADCYVCDAALPFCGREYM